MSAVTPALVVLGAQWGDEGKGKLVDVLAQDVDIVARCQVYFYSLGPFLCFWQRGGKKGQDFWGAMCRVLIPLIFCRG